jgi:hypothetical protein
VVKLQAIFEEIDTAPLQLSFAGCANEIKGIVVKDSNKTITLTDFRYTFGFIVIRIVYGRFQNSIIFFFKAIVKLPDYAILTRSIYHFLLVYTYGFEKQLKQKTNHCSISFPVNTYSN